MPTPLPEPDIPDIIPAHPDGLLPTYYGGRGYLYADGSAMLPDRNRGGELTYITPDVMAEMFERFERERG